MLSEIKDQIALFETRMTLMRRHLLTKLDKMEERILQNDKELRVKGVPYRVRSRYIDSISRIEDFRKRITCGKLNQERIRNVLISIDMRIEPEEFPILHTFHGDIDAFIRREVFYFFDFYFVWG